MDKCNISLLITESDLIVRENITEFLMNFGYTVETVVTNKELLEVVSIQPTQIVILECSEKEHDVIDIIRKIHSKDKSIVIMVMISNPSIDKLFNYINTGIHNILIKPVSLNDFRKTIESAVLQYEENFEYRLFTENRSLILETLKTQGVSIFNSQTNHTDMVCDN